MNYVITGTSRGIGLELVKQTLEAGHHVIALARDPSKSKGLVNLKEKYPQALELFKVDVTSQEQVQGFIKQLKKPVDVLINNAGVYGEHASFEKLSLDKVTETFETNSVAPMRVTRQVLPFLMMSSHPKVIHISSVMGSIDDNSSGGYYAYRMSKAALNMFNKSFSIDFPKITSVVMHPGWVKTDMGGSGATTEIPDSVRGILKVVNKVTSKDSGKFIDFEGDHLQW